MLHEKASPSQSAAVIGTALLRNKTQLCDALLLSSSLEIFSLSLTKEVSCLDGEVKTADFCVNKCYEFLLQMLLLYIFATHNSVKFNDLAASDSTM